MTFEYSPESRALQDRFDSRRLADRLAEVKVHQHFTPDDRELIERLDMFFLATVDGRGQPTCSYKGGDPGFVSVVNDTTLAFPNYDGNGMFLSMGNIAETRRVGLLFVDFERHRRLRVEGVAEISFDHELVHRVVGAQCVVLVRVETIYPNCPRYLHQRQLVERSPFVPRPEIATPTPDWKRAGWARDVLPAGDPALAATDIRRATPADRDALLDIWLRSVRATHDFVSDADLDVMHPQVRDYLASDATEFWVATDEAGQCLGFMGLSGAMMESLFLAPESFRRGVGRRLVAHALSLHRELTVDVNEQNIGARAFYEACGFVVTGRSAVDDHGRPYPILHLRTASTPAK